MRWDSFALVSVWIANTIQTHRNRIDGRSVDFLHAPVNIIHCLLVEQLTQSGSRCEAITLTLSNSVTHSVQSAADTTALTPAAQR
jgi:hypothetical protein